jgi:hypothetical protein
MRIVRVASLVLVLALFGLGIAFAPEAARSTILMQTASDFKGRFKISFPVEWQIIKARSGTPAVAGIGPAPGGQFHPNVNVVVEDLSEPISAVAYARLAKPLMAQTFRDFYVIGEGTARIAHRDGYYRYYTWKPNSGGVLYQVQAYFTVARRGYVVTGTTLNDPGSIRRDVPLIGQIFETFAPAGE